MTNWILNGKPVSGKNADMTKNWLSILATRTAQLWHRLVFALVCPSDHVESWDGWDLTADRRRELSDLDAIRVRFPDHA